MSNRSSSLLQKQLAFSSNIEMCREVIFGLRYSDITSYTGLPESTMISYDTRAVSPYLSVAKKIADLFCTSVERLCGDEINFDIMEVLALQVAFINRLGGFPVRLYKENLFDTVSKHLSLFRFDVYKLISSSFRNMISDLHRFGKYVSILKDEQIISNFTRNFHNLHTYVKVNYRKIGKATGISIGNLTRLEQGNEPMLSSVIRFADFFGISISQLLSSNPNFDYDKISDEIALKTEIANKRTEISDTKIRAMNRLRADILDISQAKKLVSLFLNKVNY